MAPYTHFKRGLKRGVQQFWAKAGRFNGFEAGLHFLNHKNRTPCYLLGLPVELLFHILVILQEVPEIPTSESQYPLLSLRLTCKRMHQLITPLIYRNVNLDTIPGVSVNDSTGFLEGSLTRTQILSHQVQTVGSFIRVASIRILKPEFWHRALDVDAAIAKIISAAPQLDSLTIIYDRQDCNPSFHSPLLDAIPALTAIRHLTFREAETPKGVFVPDVPFEECGLHIANRLLAAIIKYHGQDINSIMLYGRVELDPRLFERLRSETPNLQTLHVRVAFSFHHHSLLGEPQLWSCSRTLRSLTLLQCNFDAAYMATHLALGTLGSLQYCALFSIGYGTADESTKINVGWKGPPLDTFRLDHFMHWELDSLSIVSTRVLVVTTIDRTYLTSLIRKPAVFPRLERIRISNQWEEDELYNLRSAAASRGVEVVADWTWYEDSLADEFDLLGPCSCLGCRGAVVRL